MSINSIAPFIIKNYGLKDEDLDVIILRENLRDISTRFATAILNTQEKFKTNIRIRILEFNRNSGSDYSGRMTFNLLIDEGKTVFYNHTFSNRDCCVFFIYSDYEIKDALIFNTRIIPHEFAHHYQFVNGFPCLLPTGTPAQYFPEFTNVKMIGPSSGEVLVDGLLVKDCLRDFFKDFSERISDSICESMLIEKGLTDGLLNQYKDFYTEDLTKAIPKSHPEYSQTLRYMRRLGLLDEAVWHGIIHRTYPNDSEVKMEMKRNLRRILKLNKELPQRKEAFKNIVKIAIKTKYTEYKDVRNALTYIKQVSRLLNMEIKTKEKW